MTNKEFLALMLANDKRKDMIMTHLSDTFCFCLHNPLEFQLTEEYKTSWEMFIPGMLACTSNNEHHIAHSIGHDLTNIGYDFLKESK